MDNNVKGKLVPMTQAQIDSFHNWCLRIGAYKMMRDGSMQMSRKYRTYSPEQLRLSRELTTAKRLIAEDKARAIIAKAKAIGQSEIQPTVV